MECAEHGLHGACVRCGSFVCRACRRWVDERLHCAACQARVGDGPGTLAMAAALCSTVGLGCLLPGALGAILGGLALRAIQNGAAPPAGRPFARLALWLGLAEVAALIVALLFLAATSA